MAFCALDTLVEYETAPDIFASVGEVTHIQRSGAKRDTDETTHMQSPNQTKEFIGTLKDGGEWQFDVNFEPSDDGQQAVGGFYDSGELVNWRITLPDGKGSMSFAGIVTEFANRQLPTDKKATDSFKVKVSGAVTDTFAS